MRSALKPRRTPWRKRADERWMLTTGNSDLARSRAGYADQADDDRLAVMGPTKVGIVANNLPGASARQGDRSFGEWQRTRRRADGP